MWWLAVRPPPALGWDDDTGPPSTPLAQRDFPSAAREALRFVEALGFRFLASDAWDLSEETVVVGWEREEAVIAAGLDAIGTFWLLVLPRLGEPDNTPLRNRIELLAGGEEPLPTYGAFAVAGETSEQIARELRGHVELLRERETPLLKPGAGLQPLRTALADVVNDIVRQHWTERCEREAEAAWRDQRYEAFLDLAQQLEQLGTPLGDSERLAVARRRAKPPLTLGQEVLDESTKIRRATQLVEETQQRLAAAFEEKGNDSQAAARWKDAAREAKQALALLYSEEFYEHIDALRQGANDAVEPALTFLEVDPWCFRSGYAKETILRYLKRAELNAQQRERARRVTLHAVDVGDRREFRGYCRLARRVVDDGLRDELLARLRSEDFGRARRALWVLYALGDRLSTEDRLAAEAVIEHAATDPQWWRSSDWVARAARRYGHAAWYDSLIQAAIGRGSAAEPALRLIGHVPVVPSDEQRDALTVLVREAVQSGNGVDWLETVAPLADGPVLRSWLLETYERWPTSGVRQRSRWAILAISRRTRDGWPGRLLDG